MMVARTKFLTGIKIDSRFLLIMFLPISLTACESLFGFYTSDKSKEEEKRELVTIGDISKYPPKIEQVRVKNVSFDQVMESYQAVLNETGETGETDESAIRFESSRRIADLSLIAADTRLIQQAELADKVDKLNLEISQLQALPATLEPSLISKREKEIASNKEEISKAEAEIMALDQQNQETFKKAISIYEWLLSEQPDAEGNDVILYYLASSYDALGRDDKVVENLNQIAEKYPNSDKYTEAQFRRAETSFSSGDYVTAAEAYISVMSSKTDTRFSQHALYKHGWSLFKLSEYQLAINDFIKLRDQLEQNAAESKNRRQYNASSDEKLIADTNRVIALSFSHLSGPDELQKYFASLGGRPYELEIYNQLFASYVYQERYKDAANTYNVFLKTYPTHKEAPKMQSQILQAYIEGDFPSLILSGKIDYVRRFGINSEFWKKYVAEDSAEKTYTPEEKELLLAEVKKHLSDVSKHYHHIAQGSKKIEDYQVASTWYLEYLDTFGYKEGFDTAEILEIRKLLAESLYESGQYELAIIQFETIARNSGENKEAGANASYFALLSYQQMISNFKGDEAEKNQLVAKKAASSQIFIENYRSDKRMPDVLGNIVRDQITISDYTGAIANSRALVTLDPPASIDMQRTAWITIANAEFDAKNYAESEKSYQKVLSFDGFTNQQRTEYNKQIANSIYKNAESLQAQGELVSAAEEFLRLGQVVPDSDIRPQADFEAANIYLEAKEWNKAIDILVVFEKLYPNHKLLETHPDKMAVAYKNSNQYDKAADQYTILSRRYVKTDKELARETLWEAAQLKETANNRFGANELYREYANTYTEPLEQNVEAQYKLVQYYKDENNENQVNFWKDKIIKTHASSGDENTPRITFLAAQLKFEATEPDYSSYTKIKLTQPLKKSAERKKTQMELLLKEYEEIANMGSAEWTTASNHRIASVYQNFAEDLMESERPKGLNADELEQYSILIEEEAIPLEDKAIEIFTLNANLVQDDIYDKWVKESFLELSKLIPGRYAKFEKRAKYVESIN